MDKTDIKQAIGFGVPMALLVWAMWSLIKNAPVYETDIEKQRVYYFECLHIAADARKGKSYTTHDDEDFDAVIDSCAVQAVRMATTEVP